MWKLTFLIAAFGLLGAQGTSKLHNDHWSVQKTANLRTGYWPGYCVTSWKGDGECDDSNNNADCDWDNGDCCEPHWKVPGWDRYCSDCQCLDPNWPSTTTTSPFSTTR